MNRYNRTPIINRGQQLGTSQVNLILRAAVETGVIDFKNIVLQEGERLDIVAGREYGDANLWWIIAGASAIGWSLQVPPGTLLFVPTDLGQVSSLIN